MDENTKRVQRKMWELIKEQFKTKPKKTINTTDETPTKKRSYYCGFAYPHKNPAKNFIQEIENESRAFMV